MFELNAFSFTNTVNHEPHLLHTCKIIKTVNFVIIKCEQRNLLKIMAGTSFFGPVSVLGPDFHMWSI